MSNDKSIDYNKVGNLVDDIESIRQVWITVLFTVIGSDPLRPEFGSHLFEYFDKATNGFGGDFAAVIIADLHRWEKRCTITSLKKRVVDEKVILFIGGQFTKSKKTVEVQLNLSDIAQSSNLKSYSNAYDKLSYS